MRTLPTPSEASKSSKDSDQSYLNNKITRMSIGLVHNLLVNENILSDEDKENKLMDGVIDGKEKKLSAASFAKGLRA